MYAFLTGTILAVAWSTNALATETPSYSSLKQAFSEAKDPLTLAVLAEFDTDKTNGPRTIQNRYSECRSFGQEGEDSSKFTLDFESYLPDGSRRFGDILVWNGRLYRRLRIGPPDESYRDRYDQRISFPNQHSIVIEDDHKGDAWSATWSWEFRATAPYLYIYYRKQEKHDDGSGDFLDESYIICELI